jgi:hypothetical protein
MDKLPRIKVTGEVLKIAAAQPDGAPVVALGNA